MKKCEAAVGKTQLLYRFIKNQFKQNCQSTIGVEFYIKNDKVTINGQQYKVKLQLFDLAGQEQFRSVTSAFFRKSDGCVLVYDVTSAQSFQKLEDWIQLVKKYCDQDLPCILIGNKTDLKDKQVTIEQGQQYAIDNQMMYQEASALNGSNVKQAFEMLIEVLVKKQIQMTESLDQTQIINDDKIVADMSIKMQFHFIFGILVVQMLVIQTLQIALDKQSQQDLELLATKNYYKLQYIYIKGDKSQYDKDLQDIIDQAQNIGIWCETVGVAPEDGEFFIQHQIQLEELPMILVYDKNETLIGGMPNQMLYESEDLIMDIYAVLVQYDRIRESQMWSDIKQEL